MNTYGSKFKVHTTTYNPNSGCNSLTGEDLNIFLPTQFHCVLRLVFLFKTEQDAFFQKCSYMQYTQVSKVRGKHSASFT